MQTLMAFNARVWRLLPLAYIDTPLIAAQAPEGRFHRAGQIAAYASLSAEGAEVAIRRYRDDKVRRALVQMWVSVDRVADERGNKGASIIWQDMRAEGLESPTWDISDAARRSGAQAMLYASRSRPDLTHIVVFDPTCLSTKGPAERFEM